MNTKKRSCVLICALLFLVSISKGQVSILVNKGKFTSVEEAAVSEEKVNWSDDDLTDDRACTESFAATELAKFLSEVTNVKAEEIKYTGPKIMPRSGIVYLIGSRSSNPLIAKYSLSEEKVKLETEQSYSIKSFIENNRVISIIEGADRIGTLYGVYHYLEKLGVKFIGLGEKGRIFPDAPVDIPSSLNTMKIHLICPGGSIPGGTEK